MTYAAGQTIEAVHYNDMAVAFNKIWGYGDGGSYGYGQGNTIANVAGGSTQTVSTTEWNSLIDRVNSCGNHQFGNWGAPLKPTTSDNISTGYMSPSTISSLDGSRFSVWTRNYYTGATKGNGGASFYTTTAVEQVVYFASADAMRYFFNAGGAIRWWSSAGLGGNTKSDNWNSMLNNMGTIVMYGNGSYRDSLNYGGTDYFTSLGFWSLTSNNQFPLTHYSTDATYGYGANYVHYYCRTNGAAPGAASSLVVGVYCVDNDPDTSVPQTADLVNGTVYSNCQIYFPETTYIGNSWGAPTIG